MSDKACETCRWWFHAEDRHGRCHRYPPHPSHGFPLTGYYGLCGEWTPTHDAEPAATAEPESVDPQPTGHGTGNIGCDYILSDEYGCSYKVRSVEWLPCGNMTVGLSKVPSPPSRFRQCGWYVETAHARTLHETRDEADAYAARWKANSTWTLARIVPAYREREET